MLKNKATVLGLMSGSSLDGLDACLSSFSFVDNKWAYNIIETQTLELPEELKNDLSESSQISSSELLALDVKYGNWIAKQIADFASSADLISIHGHTVFHEPSKGFSLQIGSAEQIAIVTNKPVISNFRNTDILLGGQGAPLVPMGEKLLFPDFDGFVNLGGICNASLISKISTIAGDIGPFNQVFNHYAQKQGFEMDEGGSLSQSGNRIDELIDLWKNNPFFKESFPKSLANQWVSDNFLGIEDIAPKDVMCSFAHFITDQLSDVLNHYSPERVLLTGGGTYHAFAMSLLEQKCNTELVKPSNELINYKEALIFGFLGLLRMRGDNNVLCSATGASRDSSSGTIYRP